MNQNNIEELISALYDTVQNARAMPLGPDKCIVERDSTVTSNGTSMIKSIFSC